MTSISVCVIAVSQVTLRVISAETPVPDMGLLTVAGGME